MGEAAHPGPPSRRRGISSDECVCEENPALAGSRSRILLGNEAVEFDFTRGDSDDEPLVPPTFGAVPPCPTWVHDSCQTQESQPSTLVRVGVSASHSHLLRRGVHECLPVDGEVPVSAQTVVSSEILDALEQDLPVTMPASDSQLEERSL